MKNAFYTLILVLSLLNTACGKSGASDDSGGGSTAKTLSITPNPASATTGGTVLITPSGGTAPYTYTLLSTIGGSLSTSSGPFTLFTAGSTSGSVQIAVTDAAGLSSLFTVTVGSGAATFSISPLATTVALSGTVPFTATGGTAPYTYTVLTPNGGSFTGSTYNAPSTAMNVTISIADSAGHSAQTTVTVSNSATASAGCSGRYQLNLSGYPAYLNIVSDSTGNITGWMTLGAGYAEVTGTCSDGEIIFENQWSGSPYIGYYSANPSNPSQITMTGTWQWEGGTWSWFAASY